VLWTAYIVLLMVCLMGLSVQLGWALIHWFLSIGFGGAGHQPAGDLTVNHEGQKKGQLESCPPVALADANLREWSRSLPASPSAP
jgi:hypothetical protein